MRISSSPAAAVARELAPQPADLDVDRAVEMLGVRPARQIEQLVARQHAARMLDQREQQAELAVGQVDDDVVGIEQLRAPTGSSRQPAKRR